MPRILHRCTAPSAPAPNDTVDPKQLVLSAIDTNVPQSIEAQKPGAAPTVEILSENIPPTGAQPAKKNRKFAAPKRKLQPTSVAAASGEEKEEERKKKKKKKTQKPTKATTASVSSRVAIPATKDKSIRSFKRQKRGDMLQLRRLPFQRLVRQIASDYHTDARFQAEALAALQEAAEAYLVGLFSDAFICSLHAHRVTLQPRDLLLARRIRGELA